MRDVQIHEPITIEVTKRRADCAPVVSRAKEGQTAVGICMVAHNVPSAAERSALIRAAADVLLEHAIPLVDVEKVRLVDAVIRIAVELDVVPKALTIVVADE